MQKVPIPLMSWRGHVAHSHESKIVGGKIAYEISVNRDPQGFRLVADTASKKKLEQHLFFVGCSQTFGEGLNENQTFSNLLSHDLPRVRVVNMGFPGSGVSEHLHLWKNLSLKEFYPEQQGVMVYSIIQDHYERLRRTWRYLSWGAGNRAIYTRVGDEIKYDGVLREQASFKWAKLLKGTVFEKPWLRATSHFIPWELRGAPEEFALYLVELKREYLKQFPAGRFYVSWQAHTPPYIGANVDKEEIFEAFKKYDLDVWANAANKKDYFSPGWAESRKIPLDGHPNAFANREYANFLMTKLQSIGFTEKPVHR